MTKRPLSVLMPARDAREHLDEAVASVLAQTFSDFELIVVDDGSTDDTPQRLASWAARDARVKVVPGPGRGICAALGAGLEACRGALVARMDADDVALPRRFEAQLAFLAANPEVAAVGGRVEIFPRAEMTEGLSSYEAWLNGLASPEIVRRECFVESPLVHPAATIRADALRAAGGWRDEGWPEDYALWLELLARGHALSNVPEAVLRWRDRPDRLTRTHPAYAPRQHARLKARYLARMRLGAGRCILWGAGRTGRLFQRALAGEGVRVELFVDIDPAKVGRPLHGVPVVAPDALPPYSGAHLVAAVGAKGARALIREHLAGRGWREIEQFTCVG